MASRADGDFLSEDNGAYLVCEPCGQQVRSNEAHTCPTQGGEHPSVEELQDLRKAFIEMDDFNDIPMDGAVALLERAIQALGGNPALKPDDEREYVLTVLIDFETSAGVEPSTFLEGMEYEFRPGEDLGNIHRTEIVSWSPR